MTKVAHVGVCAFICIASLAVPKTAVGQLYEITRLDPPSTNFGNFSRATSINNEGVVVGEGSAMYTTDIMCIWTPGQPYPDQKYFFGYNRTTAAGINDLGQYIGYGPANDGTHGFFMSTDLGRGRATGINNKSQVVGWTYDSSYIYKNGVFDYLPTSYWGSAPLAINDSGIAVGYWISDCSQNCFNHACFFRNDSVFLMRTDAGDYSEATDINNRGQIVGWYSRCGNCNNFRGFIWEDGIWTTIPTLWASDTGGSVANAINDHGVVVGETRLSGGPGFYPSAFIYDTLHGIRDLNSLIPSGTGWALWSATDINEKGQIAGIGMFNGILRGFLLSPPDTSIVIVRPELDQLFIAGEKDTIKWTAENVDSVDISVILHAYSFADQTIVPIVSSYPADSGTFVWDIPDSLLSRQCRIVIQAVGDPNIVDTGSDFRIKGYTLTRITDDGEYEAFSPAIHGWSFENSSFIMWPSGWWGQFSYQSGVDPYTNAVYPSFFTTELHANPWDFIDWPLFVKTFGADTCYTTDTPTGQASDYWPSATTFWVTKSDEHVGSCVGLAATSIIAFGNKDILLQHFPEFGSFDDLYTLPLSDARREIINQLMFTQYARLPQINDDTASRNPNTAWIQKMKDMFLDEDRSNDAFLGIYNSRGGGHAVTPYKLVRDSVPGTPGETYLLYVYDNNYPGDTTRAFLIRPSDGFWRYPPTGPSPWLGYGTGLFLEPFSVYLQDADFPATAPGNEMIAANAQPLEDYESIFGFSDAAVMIRSGSDSIGFVDTMVFNSILDADPITAKTGYFSRPIGYRFPEQEVDILVSQFTDSIARFFVVKQSMIYGVSRTDVTPSDSDHFSLKSGVNFWNKDTSNKSLDLQGIVISPGIEKVYSVRKFDLNPTDSAYFDVSSSAFLYLVNVGADEFYDLTLRLASPAGGTEVAVENIFLEANAGHLIWPDWSDLTAPIRIEIDRNNDGPVDDTVYVNAQPTDISDPPGGTLPTEFKLYQNYPNPFNPVTTIAYSVPSRTEVTLEIFNVLGQSVRTLVHETKSTGTYHAEWNGLDNAGLPASTGVYLYRFTAGDIVQTKKMVLLK